MRNIKKTSSENQLDVFGSLLSSAGIDIDREEIKFTPLTGGVSSDIWRVDITGKPSLCVKRALAQLKVEAVWFAPISRNSFEVAWYNTANDLVPGISPCIRAHDPGKGMFVMDFLSPDSYPLWKDRLLEGNADPAFAHSVGKALGQIHAGTADNAEIADRFKTDNAFFDLRLEPYLKATAQIHTQLTDRMQHLISVTQTNKHVLVHGDISPKNILIGPKNPVILDAECAWYGDPAFDPAFCLNHLMLKCIPARTAVTELALCFNAFFEAYKSQITWEPVYKLEQRIAHLLPALLLARIDGKSPVEYIHLDEDKRRVISFAIKLLIKSTDKLAEIIHLWQEEMRL